MQPAQHDTFRNFVANSFLLWLNDNNAMAKQDDLDALEKLKAAAAEKGDFDSFQRAHRQAEALRGGKSYINGQPAAVALGGQVAPVEDAPAVVASDPSKLQAVKDNIVATAANHDAEQLNKYNQFLRDQGVNPDTIGAATVDTSYNGAGNLVSTMDNPTLQQQELATNLANQASGYHNQVNIAANRAIERGNPGLGNQLKNIADAEVPASVSGRSSQQNLMYWLNRLRNNVQVQRSNGYASQ